MRWLLILVLTASCTAIVPETARRMASVDPLSADPAGFAVTLALPEGVDVQTGGAQLSLTVTNPTLGQAGETWVLAETRDAEGHPTYRFAKSDLPEVRRVQATAADWEARDPKNTEGSLSVALAPCRTVETVEIENSRVSVFIALTQGANPMPLLRNVPLRRVLRDTKLGDLPDCQ